MQCKQESKFNYLGDCEITKCFCYFMLTIIDIILFYVSTVFDVVSFVAQYMDLYFKNTGTRDTYRDTGMGNVNKNGNIKRPMNAFMVWARSYRGHLTMLYPNESNKLVSQRLGEIWKKMSMEDKQPYYREADRIKRQHRKDYPGRQLRDH